MSACTKCRGNGNPRLSTSLGNHHFLLFNFSSVFFSEKYEEDVSFYIMEMWMGFFLRTNTPPCLNVVRKKLRIIIFEVYMC